MYTNVLKYGYCGLITISTVLAMLRDPSTQGVHQEIYKFGGLGLGGR